MCFIKRFVFLCYLCFALNSTASAHSIFLFREGVNINIAPTITYQRLYSKPNNSSFISNNIFASCFFFLSYDFFLKKNYYFNTGLCYRFHRIHLQSEKVAVDDNYFLQYIQVPFSLKAYILKHQNNIFFLQIGPAVAINTYFNYNKPSPFVNKIVPFELSGSVCLGAERMLNNNSALYIALQYQMGFTNILFSTKEKSIPKLYLKNNFASLFIGLKF